MEFRESSYVLNAKCQRDLFANMTFNLSLGFQNLELPSTGDKRGKVYSLLLADTVLVGEDEAKFLTTAPREYKDVSFFFKVLFICLYVFISLYFI